MQIRKIFLAKCLTFGLTAILSGCYGYYPCGDGPDGLCKFGERKYVPPPRPVSPYVAENMTFAVSLNDEGKPIFSAPPGLKDRPYYIVSLYVDYPQTGGKSVWEVRGENRSGTHLPDEMRFNPDIPIVYGKKPSGTFEVSSPAVLRLGHRYVFFANLAYEDESGDVKLTRGTVGFTLIGTGNTPHRIESSRTRHDGTN